jgi:hypothetical protein
MENPRTVVVLLLFSGCSSSVILAPDASLYSQPSQQNCRIMTADSIVHEAVELRVETTSVSWMSREGRWHLLPRSNVTAVQFIDHAGGFIEGLRIGTACGLGAAILYSELAFGNGGEEGGALILVVGGLGALIGVPIGGIVGGLVGNTETYVLRDSTSTSAEHIQHLKDTLSIQ